MCKHWRAALAALPGRYPHLDINTAIGDPIRFPNLTPAEAAAAERKETGRARALAARAPTVDEIRLQLRDSAATPAALTAAYTAALQALLDRPVSRLPVGELV